MALYQHIIQVLGIIFQVLLFDTIDKPLFAKNLIIQLKNLCFKHAILLV